MSKRITKDFAWTISAIDKDTKEKVFFNYWETHSPDSGEIDGDFYTEKECHWWFSTRAEAREWRESILGTIEDEGYDYNVEKIRVEKIFYPINYCR